MAEVFYILQNVVLAHRKPFLASFKLTYRCNLTCRQCPFYSMVTLELTYEQAIRIIDRLYERGNRILIFALLIPYSDRSEKSEARRPT